MVSWRSVDDAPDPGGGIGVALLLVVIGVLLLLVGWLAVTTFLSLLTDLSGVA